MTQACEQMLNYCRRREKFVEISPLENLVTATEIRAKFQFWKSFDCSLVIILFKLTIRLFAVYLRSEGMSLGVSIMK